jgi:multisubunit Na+/H+ antiporter MnhC subunit
VANNKKSTPRYDLKAQDRKRNLAIQLGLTAIVVIFAVALVLYIVMGHDKKTGSRRTR